VIASFADRDTEADFRRGRVRKFHPGIQRAALRKLLLSDAAATLEDLRVPPGNRLGALKEDLAGMHGIRVNDQWRIIVRWERGSAFDVRLTDYH
jgi:proteic killer suppression protein